MSLSECNMYEYILCTLTIFKIRSDVFMSDLDIKTSHILSVICKAEVGCMGEEKKQFCAVKFFFLRKDFFLSTVERVKILKN